MDLASLDRGPRVDCHHLLARNILDAKMKKYLPLIAMIGITLVVVVFIAIGFSHEFSRADHSMPTAQHLK
jgi:hypothetical protein